MSDMQGEKGERGKQGIEGLKGQIGKMGLKGNQGNRGNPGEQGKAGEKGSDPTRRLLIMFVFVVIVFTLLSARTEINAHRISAIQSRTSDRVLCPLYELFLASVAHPQPEQVDTPDERKQFDDAVKVIRDGYTTLGCKPILH